MDLISRLNNVCYSLDKFLVELTFIGYVNYQIPFVFPYRATSLTVKTQNLGRKPKRE